MTAESSDIDALEAAARAATPGRWTARICCSGATWDEFDPAGLGFEVDGPPEPTLDRHRFASGYDAQFIAAANPSAVLALIGRVRALEWADGVKRVIDAERRGKAGATGRMSVVQLDVEILDEWFDALYDLDQDEAVEMLKNELRSLGARQS